MKPVLRNAFEILVAVSLAPSFGANINVSPGTDTIANALSSASDGDVLLLSDGTYDGSGVTISKSVTIRAASKAANPVILHSLTPNSDELTLQGLELRSSIGFSSFVPDNATITLLENRFTAGGSLGSTIGRATTGDIFIVGNEWQQSEDIVLDVNSRSLVYFAGNRMSVSSGKFLRVRFLGNGDLIAVGNSIVGGRVGNLIRAEMTNSRAIANRFEMRLDVSACCDTSAKIAAILNIKGGGTNRVMNNLFLLTDVSTVSSSTVNVTGLNSVRTDLGTIGTEISNNVIDFRGLSFNTSARSDEGAIHIKAPATIAGNIFTGLTRPTITVDGGVTEFSFAHNLCFQTFEACGTTDGNQDADPLFVDNVDYVPGMGSPGIDAGPDEAFLADLDGSRVDLGIYGGSFPIDQYDAQRTDSSTAPYIYPRFNASRNVTVLGDLPIQVFGFVKLR